MVRSRTGPGLFGLGTSFGVLDRLKPTAVVNCPELS
jgi:hypothetical protein